MRATTTALRGTYHHLHVQWPASSVITTYQRYFSSQDIPEPTIDLHHLQATILSQTPQISRHLSTYGYYTTTSLLPQESIFTLRKQAISLRKQGRYVPSFSEKLEGSKIKRFDKKGVYACEPDGGDYYTAPDLISYIATLLQTLPSGLNEQLMTKEFDLSNAAFNAKLAVTMNGARYPCHIDNPVGNCEDVRKLTAILYLNPDWIEGDGGEIRLFLKDENVTVKKMDLSPIGGRLLLFWSDEIPHEVLPTSALELTSANASDETSEDNAKVLYSDSDRYALTVWIPTENRGVLHDERSKFSKLKDSVHFG